MSATFNGERVVSLRILQPWRGVPVFDVDVDPDLVQTIPSTGPATITIGIPPGPVSVLTGVIDPLGSGSFVATAHVRVLAGSGGWGKRVTAQPFGPTSTTTLYNAVAAQVLEKPVVDVTPGQLSNGYLLAAGPASQVFAFKDWWVDPITGVTTVGPRPPAVPDPSLEILDWNPLQKVAELACDALIMPGTPLVDPRIGEAPVIIRHVEQTFDKRGSRARAWCSTNTVSPLQAALYTMVREFSGARWLCARRYRVVSPGSSPTQWNLQAVDRGPLGQADPMPDALNITMWSGIAGGTAKLTPGSQVLLGFVDGDPSQAVILGYGTSATDQPLEVTLDATAAAHIAPTAQAVDVGDAAALVAIAGGVEPLVVAPWATGAQTALSTFAGAIETAGSPPPTTLAQAIAMLTAIATAAQNLGSALSGLPPPATLKTKAT